MVVTGDAVLVADGDVFIDDIVAVAVHQLGQFRPLHDVGRVIVFYQQAQRFVQTGGKQLVFDLCRIISTRIGNEPYFAAARTGEQLAVGPELQTADLHHDVLWQGQRQQPVILGLLTDQRVRGRREDVRKILVKAGIESGFKSRRKHGADVKAPFPIVIADLDQEPVLSAFQLQHRLTLIRGRGTMHILGDQPLAVQPQGQCIVAAE